MLVDAADWSLKNATRLRMTSDLLPSSQGDPKRYPHFPVAHTCSVSLMAERTTLPG